MEITNCFRRTRKQSNEQLQLTSFQCQHRSGMFTCLVVLYSLSAAAALQGMLEMFEQINGTDMINTNLRVRKINRTTAGLYGNSTIEVVLDNEYKASFIQESIKKIY